MTNGQLIEPKVEEIRRYIYYKTKIDIVNINLQTHEDLEKLNWAYNFIINNKNNNYYYDSTK